MEQKDKNIIIAALVIGVLAIVGFWFYSYGKTLAKAAGLGFGAWLAAELGIGAAAAALAAKSKGTNPPAEETPPPAEETVPPAEEPGITPDTPGTTIPEALPATPGTPVEPTPWQLIEGAIKSEI